MFDNKGHWENIFLNKDTSKVSWYQQKPQMSLDLIECLGLRKSDLILEVGGGDSRLADGLLELEYQNISVLDISKYAITSSQKRLGKKASQINWIESNLLDFQSDQQYSLWHDRAVFHFIRDEKEQLQYKSTAINSLKDNGILVLGGFSKNDGPTKCSGLDIAQHDRLSIEKIFCPDFEIVRDFEDKHETPSGSEQNFYWVILKKK